MILDSTAVTRRVTDIMQVLLQHRVLHLKPDLSHSFRNDISKRKYKLRVLGSFLCRTLPVLYWCILGILSVTSLKKFILSWQTSPKQIINAQAYLWLLFITDNTSETKQNVNSSFLMWCLCLLRKHRFSNDLFQFPDFCSEAGKSPNDSTCHFALVLVHGRCVKRPAAPFCLQGHLQGSPAGSKLCMGSPDHVVSLTFYPRCAIQWESFLHWVDHAWKFLCWWSGSYSHEKPGFNHSFPQYVSNSLQ